MGCSSSNIATKPVHVQRKESLESSKTQRSNTTKAENGTQRTVRIVNQSIDDINHPTDKTHANDERHMHNINDGKHLSNTNLRSDTQRSGDIQKISDEQSVSDKHVSNEQHVSCEQLDSDGQDVNEEQPVNNEQKSVNDEQHSADNVHHPSEQCTSEDDLHSSEHHTSDDEQHNSDADQHNSHDEQHTSNDEQHNNHVDQHSSDDEQHTSNNEQHNSDDEHCDEEELANGDVNRLSGDHDVNATPDYTPVDAHARNAPPALRNSTQKLVAYLSQVASEPKMIVRAIFVWISENIAYDTDGFFGRQKIAPTDAESVMRIGSSVCEGYANVITTLCREAGIPVQKISGYAKGYGSSADRPVTTDVDTNHAWNAVQLGGKWFLIDSTWGAGHLDTNNTFNKSFEEFYFLTDPEQFVYAHFPYMNNDMDASNKWQLLKRPISLEEFNNFVSIKPNAFKLGVKPVSHKHGLLRMKNEVTLTFGCDGNEEVEYMSTLSHKQDNMLYKKAHNTFDQIENGLFTTRIHPHTTGIFKLTIFGRKASKDGTSLNQLLEYVIKCDKAGDADFTFPYTYIQAQTDRCVLIAPLQGKLPQNSAVEFHIISPYLSRVMINKTFLEKNGTSFKGSTKTGSKDNTLSVYGSRNSEGSLQGLYKFDIV